MHGPPGALLLPAVQFFGIFPTGVLVDGAVDTPWADELEQKVFESSVGIGPYIEAAFFHKATRTLLVTDAVISVPANPPEVWRQGGQEAGPSSGASSRQDTTCSDHQQQQQGAPANCWQGGFSCWCPPSLSAHLPTLLSLASAAGAHRKPA